MNGVCYDAKARDAKPKAKVTMLEKEVRRDRKWMTEAGPCFITYNCQSLSPEKENAIAIKMKGTIVGIQGTRLYCREGQEPIRHTRRSGMVFFHFRAMLEEGRRGKIYTTGAR